MSLRDASCRSKKKKWDAARFAQLLTIPIDRDAVNAADEYHRTPLLLAVSLGTFFFSLALKCSGCKRYFTSGLLCEVKALIAAGADPNVSCRLKDVAGAWSNTNEEGCRVFLSADSHSELC